MFTGIITDIGEVVHAEINDSGARFSIACHFESETLRLGASIACAGVCQTIVAVDNLDGGRAMFSVDTSPETLALTTLAGWQAGTLMNLERSLTLSDELGGHLVQGHVDGIGTIIERAALAGYTLFRVQVPAPLRRFVAKKGAIALDGVSLTINAVDAGASLNRQADTHGDGSLDVLLIPHSLDQTTWKERQAGDPVNIEVDMMARYAQRLMQFTD